MTYNKKKFKLILLLSMDCIFNIADYTGKLRDLNPLLKNPP